MKKIFTFTAICAVLLSANMQAQDFPSDPGTLMVDLKLYALDATTGDTLTGFAPEGSGAYTAGTEVTATAKTIPGYTFVRWSDMENSNPRTIVVNAATTLSALYNHDEYTITFRNDDGAQLAEMQYFYGAEVKAPEAPEKENTDQYSYIFKGWTPEIANVTGPQTYTAVWDTVVNKYEIIFLDWNREELRRDSFAYGAMPEYRGTTPTREQVEGVTYTWSGWEPELHEVTGAERYTATYTTENIRYTVNATVTVGEQTLTYTNDTATYGQQVFIELTLPNDYHFSTWSDGSSEFPRTITVTGDTTLTGTALPSFVDIDVAANQWTFFCMPMTMTGGISQDMFMTDELADVAWGAYNGAARAEARSGWETAETFTSGRGYIVYSSQAGRLRLNIYPENLMQEAYTADLSAYEAEHEQNANWNFVGNPYYAQIAANTISVTGTEEASATIWNGTGYTNELLNSETLVLQPLQAFFIQTDGAGSLAFRGANSTPAPARRAVVEENSRIDIEATAGGYTDKTRVIFRSNSSLKYEAGRDASKFMTASAPVQMYFLDVDDVQCAQMVRPAGEDAMRIGYMLRSAGEIEINMPVYAEDYELYDALTDRSYDLSERISLYSEAGTYNSRLSLRPIRRVATAVENTSAGSTTKLLINNQLYLLRDGKVYTVQGILAK